MRNTHQTLAKPIGPILLFSAFLSAHSIVSAEVALGNKGVLAFGADAELKYDSNISANSGEDGDMIASALPKVLYRYDQGSIYVDAFAGIEFVEYDEQSQFDSENFKSEIVIEYPAEREDAPFDLRFVAGYNESTSADSDLQSIVEREKINIDLSGRYYIADRYYIRSGFEYRDEAVETLGFNDVTTTSVPVDLYYRYSELLSFGFGLEYRDVSIDGPVTPTADSEDLAYYFAVEGSLLSNLESEIKVGYQERDFDAGAFDDADALFVRGILRWFYRDRTTIELELNSGFRNSARNSSVEETSAELSFAHRFDEKLASELSFEYSEADFETLNGLQVRSDDSWAIEWETNYVLIDDRLSLDLVLRYMDQSSDLSVADYDRSIIQLGLSFIY